MPEIGSYEAKTNLSRLLEQVAKGERFTITRHGVPIAELIPATRKEKHKVSEAIAEILRFRKGRRLNGIPLKKLIEEGRK